MRPEEADKMVNETALCPNPEKSVKIYIIYFYITK